MVLQQVVVDIHNSRSNLSSYSALFSDVYVDGWWRSQSKLKQLTEAFLLQQSSFFKECILHWIEDTKVNRIPHIGYLRTVRFTGSDRHHNGQQVVLFIGSQKSLVYKPRSLKPELCVQDYMSILDLPSDMRLLFPRSYDCGGYGWQEYVAHLECKTLSDIKAFYYRAGVLVGMLESIGFQDGHFENIIACGSYPVPIDLETIFAPIGEVKDADGQDIEQGVLTTGLVEMPTEHQAAPFQFHAFGRTLAGVPVAEQDRSLDISIRWRHFEKELNTSAVLYRQTPQSITTYLDFFLQGCEDVYVLILNKKSFILQHDTWWSSIAQCPVRLILRSTLEYQTILWETLYGQKSYQILYYQAPHLSENIINSEIQALLRMDIPSFRMYPGKELLYEYSSTPLDGKLGFQSLQDTKERIQRIDLDFISRQIFLLRQALTQAPADGDLES